MAERVHKQYNFMRGVGWEGGGGKRAEARAAGVNIAFLREDVAELKFILPILNSGFRLRKYFRARSPAIIIYLGRQ